MIDRRQFIGAFGAAGAWTLAGCRTGLGETSAGYSVAILGDLHFDAEPESAYHAHYRNEGKPEWLWKVQRQEFARNGEMWRQRCREMVAASARVAHERPGTGFVLQLGDLIQGDCDDADTHKRMLDDCIRMVRAPYPKGLRFLSVVGNHDFRGEEAWNAYFEYMEKYLGSQLATSVRYPAFSFRHGPDCWIFCHFEAVELTELVRLIEDAADARHVFLVTHGPFTPGESTNWRWRLGGSEYAGAFYRERLMKALLTHRVVVLSGHTHEIAWWRISGADGAYSEFTVNSVWSAPERATAEPLASRPDQYGEDTIARLEAKGDRRKADEYRAEIAPFKRALSDYFFNRGAGHFRLNVGAEHVNIEYFPGAALVPAKTFELK